MSVEVDNTQLQKDGGAGVADTRAQMPAARKEEDNDFAALLHAYEERAQTFSEGEVIKGRVIAISAAGVVVDVGFKSEGIIPAEQFMDDHGKLNVAVGDSVDVFLEQTENSNGYVV